jgi:hypothetical protein
MRRRLTTLIAKSGHSQNGAPRQLIDETVYREYKHFIAVDVQKWDPAYSGWSNSSRPKDFAVSLRSVAYPVVPPTPTPTPNPTPS